MWDCLVLVRIYILNFILICKGCDIVSYTIQYQHQENYCTGDCFDREIRLSEGETEWEGRLEVCIGQRWGTVGNNGWTKENSQVMCNALGFEFTGIKIIILNF